MHTDTMHFFFGKENPLSNWYDEGFWVNGIWFEHGEQCMMYSKAMLFGDHQMAERILRTHSQMTCKQLGHQVSGFNSDGWDIRSSPIVTAICLQKAKQIVRVQHELKLSQKKIIVEASPFDKNWGVGLAETNPLIHDVSNWRGQNKLGYCWMDVRDNKNY